MACRQANDVYGAGKRSALKRILPAGNMAHEYVKRCGDCKKSARPRKLLFLDKKMDPVKKEVHGVKGPVHLLAVRKIMLGLWGVPCPGSELWKTSESDNDEVFGAPIRAKRAAHLSGEIANCLRPLGRVFAI